MVIFSLDFGVKKMGVAVGNTAVKTAQPLMIIPMQNGTPDWQDLLELIRQWQAKKVLVGLPLNLDGSESHLSKRAKKFAKRLNHRLKQAHIACQVSLVDERLSTFSARHMQANTVSNSPVDDKIDDKAALVLLHSYFNEPVEEVLP